MTAHIITAVHDTHRVVTFSCFGNFLPKKKQNKNAHYVQNLKSREFKAKKCPSVSKMIITRTDKHIFCIDHLTSSSNNCDLEQLKFISRSRLFPFPKNQSHLLIISCINPILLWAELHPVTSSNASKTGALRRFKRKTIFVFQRNKIWQPAAFI